MSDFQKLYEQSQEENKKLRVVIAFEGDRIQALKEQLALVNQLVKDADELFWEREEQPTDIPELVAHVKHYWRFKDENAEELDEYQNIRTRQGAETARELQDEIEEMEDTIDEQESDKDELEEENRKLEKENKRLEEENRKLEEGLQEAQRKMEELVQMQKKVISSWELAENVRGLLGAGTEQ